MTLKQCQDRRRVYKRLAKKMPEIPSREEAFLIHLAIVRSIAIEELNIAKLKEENI